MGNVTSPHSKALLFFCLQTFSKQTELQWFCRETIKIRHVHAIFQTVWQILVQEKLEKYYFHF